MDKYRFPLLSFLTLSAFIFLAGPSTVVAIGLKDDKEKANAVFDTLAAELKMKCMSYCNIGDLSKMKAVSSSSRDIANALLAPSKEEEAFIRRIYDNICNCEFGVGSTREEMIKKSPVLAERIPRAEHCEFPNDSMSDYFLCYPERDVVFNMKEGKVSSVLFGSKGKLKGLTVPKVQEVLGLDVDHVSLEFNLLSYKCRGQDTYGALNFYFNKKTGEIIDVIIWF